jgi:histidine phosphotransferase ChpT
MTVFALDPLDLAALLCSRVCHDVIGPVGAIINGLEMLDEEQDAEMRGFALELIKKSAGQASARLQFCRLAFGAAGSAGVSIDTSDAAAVARGLFGGERAELEWNVPPLRVPRNNVKLILNMCLIAATAIPRGGVIEVTLSGAEETARITVTAKGTNAKLAGHLPLLLAGTPDHPPARPQDIQAYYAGLVAKAANMTLTVAADADRVMIEAEPLSAKVIAEAVAL